MRDLVSSELSSRIGSTPERRTPMPSATEIWHRPLPFLRERWGTRLTCRLLTSAFRRRLLGFEGLDHVAPDRDPFILALNHSQRPEAVLIPAWLCFFRAGRMVHFMADWNFLLVPGLAQVIRLHDPIVVARKAAKPRILNRLKRSVARGKPPFEEAQDRLAAGRSVGIFPEGTVNRHPNQLLRGHLGVARLAIQAQVPVVPGGIRFSEHRGSGPIGDGEPFSVHFGPPLLPPLTQTEMGSLAPVFHAQIMSAISTLCGKEWQPDSRRTKYAFSQA